MKLLRVSFQLILIVWALQVNAAEQGSQSQQQSPNQSAKSKTEQTNRNNQAAEKIEPDPRQTLTPTTTPQISKPIPSKDGKNGKNEKTQDGWVETTWTWMLSNADTIFNGLLVLFSGLLWWVTRRQVALTEQAEETSHKSLEIAELALKSDRPYLLIEKARMFGIQGHDSYGGLSSTIAEYDHFVPNAVFSFRNFGNGPAFIDEAIIHMFPLIDFPKVNDFTGCKLADIGGVEAVGAGEPWKVGIGWVEDRLISKPDYEEIVKGNKRIFVWGRIRYKDVLGGSYETVFCWVAQPPIEVFRAVGEPPVLTISMEDRFIRGPKTHNYTK